MTSADHARRYCGIGWHLVPIPAGSKAPTTFGWQNRGIACPDEAAKYWTDNPSHNMGLLHGPSNTCALDIDDMSAMRILCDGLGIDLDAILASAPRIVGRPDRGKVLFRAPDGLTTRKLSWPLEGDTRRTGVVFELRAGSVQDVLPPSVHPDTGNPYTWAGASFDRLPPIPDQLLIIWREWDRFRPQLMDLCPWAPKREFVPPPKRRREGESVIDAYNATVTIAEALESAGYRQIGKRWLSPNSSSGIPGVVIFDDGRAYSHHASDPFDSAHTFDAFDVLAHYQHAGNVSAAVRAVADKLQIDSLPEGPTEEEREAIAHGASIWASWQRSTRTDAVVCNVPRHLLSVPGILQRVVEYSAATSIKRQPQFDVQAALALGSVVMGRRFITSSRNMTGLLFLNVAKTGSGKEHVNSVIEDILEAAGHINLRGPNGYTSAPAVLSALKDKPCHITIIDEFGKMLESANAKGNQHKKDAFVMIMEAFGRQTKILRNIQYSTHGLNENQKKALNIEIRNPSLTLIGMTTPETFYEAIAAKDAASGFLNRFIIVESEIGRQKSRRPQNVDVPQDLIDWVQKTAKASASESLVQDQGAEFPPDPVLIPFGKTAYDLFDQYEDRILAAQDKNDAMADMLNRSREIAMRLSLIVAHSLGEQEISETAAQWAIDYVDYYAQGGLRELEANMAEGSYDRVRKQAANAILKSGAAGLTMAALLKAVPSLGNMRKFERDGLLEQICTDYPIERVKSASGRGRPSIVHRKIIGDG